MLSHLEHLKCSLIWTVKNQNKVHLKYMCHPLKQRLSGKRRRPSIVDKFPQVIECATSFIKQHGYSAHSRWMTDTANVCGVTLAQIRDHLLQKIPDLKQHGLGLTTVAYLTVPPQHKPLLHRGTRVLLKHKFQLSKPIFRNSSLLQRVCNAFQGRVYDSVM